MGYLHINNLYKDKEILLFRECYAMEKIHGTSAHLSWNDKESGDTDIFPSRKELKYFAGGAKHENFVKLFNHDELLAKLVDLPPLVIFGEAYGGNIYKMSHIYGKELNFVAFDVKIGDSWLSVPQACNLVEGLSLDFVDYMLISTDLEEIDRQRDRESIQAIKNGMGPGLQREGIVLRPLIELTKNNGERLIVKHKQDWAKETKTPRVVNDDKQKIMEDAKAIAEEWVTHMRLGHVLQKFGEGLDLSQIPAIIKVMLEDVQREAAGEIAWNKDVQRAIGTRTAQMTKAYFTSILREANA